MFDARFSAMISRLLCRGYGAPPCFCLLLIRRRYCLLYARRERAIRHYAMLRCFMLMLPLCYATRYCLPRRLPFARHLCAQMMRARSYYLHYTMLRATLRAIDAAAAYAR